MSYANSATPRIVPVLHSIPAPPLLIFSTSSQVELLRAEERIAATQRDFNELKNLSQQVRTVRHAVLHNMMLHCVETPAHSDDDHHVCYLSTFSVHDMITPGSSLPFSVPIPCPPRTHFHIPLQHTTPHPTLSSLPVHHLIFHSLFLTICPHCLSIFSLVLVC